MTYVALEAENMKGDVHFQKYPTPSNLNPKCGNWGPGSQALKKKANRYGKPPGFRAYGLGYYPL